MIYWISNLSSTSTLTATSAWTYWEMTGRLPSLVSTCPHVLDVFFFCCLSLTSLSLSTWLANHHMQSTASFLTSNLLTPFFQCDLFACPCSPCCRLATRRKGRQMTLSIKSPIRRIQNSRITIAMFSHLMWMFALPLLLLRFSLLFIFSLICFFDANLMILTILMSAADLTYIIYNPVCVTVFIP
jgi:hypothetical protein